MQIIIIDSSLIKTGTMLASKPELFDMWCFERNTCNIYNIKPHSEKKVHWNCDRCGCYIGVKQVRYVFKRKFKCPACDDGFSTPEKFIRQILMAANIKFDWDVAFKWSSRKRYDFYFELNDKKYIIECHGEQHYKGNFVHVGGRTLDEEEYNDQIKYEMAMSNGIDKYIVIDCRDSSYEFLSESYTSSELCEVIGINDECKLQECYKNTFSSFLLSVVNDYNNGMIQPVKLSDKHGLGLSTIKKYLRKADSVGMVKWDNKINYANREIKHRKRIGMLNLENGIWKIEMKFKSIADAGRYLGVHYSGVSKVIGKDKVYKGRKWIEIKE